MCAARKLHFFWLVRALALSICGLSIFGCGVAGSVKKEGEVTQNHPGNEQGAKELLRQFLKPDAQHAQLSKTLQPSTADYAAVYESAFAKKLEAKYEPAWQAGQLVVAPKPGQTDLLIWSATADDLKKGTGNASRFPGGYRDVAPHLKDGVTLYFFKFVEPGKDLGMAYDGLVHVNGKWRIIPKPFRALKG